MASSTDHLQRKKHMLQVVAWLRENYKVGKSGSTSKNAVYQHYSDMCSERGIEPSINATYFGKLVKRAFPGVQYNRKGPRGNSLQHYTHLKRINHEKLKQQRLVEEASRTVETCGVPEEEALYRLMREKYAEMFAPLAAGLDVARAPHHYAAAPLHPVAAAAALLAADGGEHPSTSYARSTRTGLLSPGDAALHADPRFRAAAAAAAAAAASSLHSRASDPDGATGSESPASGSPSLPPPSSSSSLGSRFLSSSLSISTGASPPAGSSYAHLGHPSAHHHHHHQAGKASTAGFPSSSAHYVVSSSPPSSPGSGHQPCGGGGAYAPGHGHGAFGPTAFAYPPTCPYCHHCLHCYYSGGGAPAAGPAAFFGGSGGGHVNAYAPSPHPAGPSSAAAAAAHLVTAKEASVLAQWVRERPFLPPIGTHASALRSADSTNIVDDDDDDADGRGRRDETEETHSHRRESARAQGPSGRVAGQW